MAGGFLSDDVFAKAFHFIYSGSEIYNAMRLQSCSGLEDIVHRYPVAVRDRVSVLWIFMWRFALRALSDRLSREMLAATGQEVSAPKTRLVYTRSQEQLQTT